MNRNRLFQIELKLRKESVHPFLWRWYPDLAEQPSPREWALAFSRVDGLVWLSTVWAHLNRLPPPQKRVASEAHFDNRWRFQLLNELMWVDPTLDSQLPEIPTPITPDNVSGVVDQLRSLQRRSRWRRILFFPHRFGRWFGQTLKWGIFQWPVLLYELNVFALMVYMLLILTLGYGLFRLAFVTIINSST